MHYEVTSRQARNVYRAERHKGVTSSFRTFVRAAGYDKIDRVSPKLAAILGRKPPKRR